MIDFRNICNSLLILVFFTLSFSLSGQVGDNIIYQKVKVHLEKRELREIGKLGLEIEHGYNRSKNELVNFYSLEEVKLLKDAGFRIDIMIEDAVAHYLEESKKVKEVDLIELRNTSCYQNGPQYDVPGNFKYGSMGSYLTLDQIMSELDLMRTKYPNLITIRQSVGTKTKKDNYVQFVKISDFPDVDETLNEKQILYTALHHAREPMSMMQMIYFMWYILEKYSTDPEIKYLLDKTELFFIPCVNPDGYKYNEKNQPLGGGLWRKNLNEDESPVDINRNYFNGWGHDDEGSSPIKAADTYRGSSALSEVETKAVRTLFNSKKFDVVVNYHSFGNVMIYPWGFSEKNTTDHLTFLNFAQDLTQHTDYGYGLNSETLGYPINGTADDWMYGTNDYLNSSKRKAFSFTFECGASELSDSESFWPLKDKIQPTCASMLYQNLRSLWLLNEGIKIQSVSDQIILPTSNKARLKVTRLGLSNEEVIIYVRPITDNVFNFNEDFTFDLPHLQSQTFDIPYQLVNNARGEVKFEINYFYSGLRLKDTITYYIHKYQTRFESNGDSMTPFVGQDNGFNWVLDYDDYYDTDASFALNNLETYGKAENKILETKNAIYIPESDSLTYLSFYSKWFIEKNIDFMKVFASADGSFYEPLCGNYSQIGNIDQGEEDPVIDGYQPDWVNVLMDISNYRGKTIYLKFLFRSDAKVNRGGVNLDAIKVIGIPGKVLSGNKAEQPEHVFVAPNPANNRFYIYRDIAEKSTLTLFNSSGKAVLRKQILNKTEEVDVLNFTSGLYIYKIDETNTGKSVTGKILITGN